MGREREVGRGREMGRGKGRGRRKGRNSILITVEKGEKGGGASLSHLVGRTSEEEEGLRTG